MKVRIGYTANDGKILSRLIRWITGGRYSHCLVIFENGAETMYFESWHRKDEVTGKTGVRGPIPLHKITDWANQDRTRHIFATQPAGDDWLPVSSGEAFDMFDKLCLSARRVKYAPLQLFANWMEQRIRWTIRRNGGSKTKWTCSETVLRVLPHRARRYFDLLDYNADSVVPSGTKTISVESAVNAWITDAGTV